MKTHKLNQIGPPRLRIATHALVRLAHSDDVLSSAAIATQVNSHATFLRRVLACLSKSGIVEAREGRDGGYYLKRPVDELTLAEIYEAVKTEEECTETASESPECLEVIVQLDQILEDIMNHAELEMIKYLQKYTLRDVMNEITFK